MEELILSGTVENDIFHSYNFEFKQGINIVIGKNGCGKTSLLKSICDIKKNNGSVLLNKKTINKHIYSYYFSGDLLGEEDMTLKENIYYNIEFKENQVLEEYKKLIEIFELQKYENIIYKKASEGMKQKMHIIICLLHKKAITIMDEPFNYLDERSCKEFVLYLNENQKMHSNMIIIATNELSIINEFEQKRIINIEGDFK